MQVNRFKDNIKKKQKDREAYKQIYVRYSVRQRWREQIKIGLTFSYKLKEEFLEARVKERERAVINLIRNTYKSFRLLRIL